MMDLILLGGPIMWVILLCFVVAAAVFLERAYQLHRARIKPDDFIRGVFNILRRNNIPEAVAICEETPGPVAAIVRAAIRQTGRGAEAVTRAVDEAARRDIVRLERRFGVLAVTGHLAPLLGILGTVIGLIQVFMALQQRAPLIQMGDVAGGVWQALLTTVAGLIVALLSHAGYNLVVSKMDALIQDMEFAAAETEGFFAGPDAPAAGQTAKGGSQPSLRSTRREDGEDDGDGRFPISDFPPIQNPKSKI